MCGVPQSFRPLVSNFFRGLKMMNRRIKVGRVDRRSNMDKFFYIDPITAMESQQFATPGERDAEIALHYEETAACQHLWERLTIVRSRSEPGMISGQQECVKCCVRSFYNTEEE